MTEQLAESPFPAFGPGDRIRKIRREMLHPTMSQDEFAQAIGQKKATVSAWESGDNQGGVTADVARSIEALVGVPGTAVYVMFGAEALGVTQPPPRGGKRRGNLHQLPYSPGSILNDTELMQYPSRRHLSPVPAPMERPRLVPVDHDLAA